VKKKVKWPNTTTLGSRQPDWLKLLVLEGKGTQLIIENKGLTALLGFRFGTAVATKSAKKFSAMCVYSVGRVWRGFYEKQILRNFHSFYFGIIGRVLDQRSCADN